MSEPLRPGAGTDVCVVDGAGANQSAAPPAGPRRKRSGSRPGLAGDVRSSRQRILDVAYELFSSGGYQRTPLRAISESLGVTKAAVYYHFKAKEDLLVAIVGPTLDGIDRLIDGAGPETLSADRRRLFLSRYVDELTRRAGVIALLLRDQAVGEHPLGRRFAGQHLRMRNLLGAAGDPASLIRTTAALWALELAVAEFGATDPAELRETAVGIAVAVLDS